MVSNLFVVQTTVIVAAVAVAAVAVVVVAVAPGPLPLEHEWMSIVACHHSQFGFRNPIGCSACNRSSIHTDEINRKRNSQIK